MYKFLESYNTIIKKKSMSDYRGKKIAIDISILIYQIVISIRNSGTDFTNKKGELVSHILGLFNKTISFLNHGILPIYVFDGKPPKIKYKLLKSRKMGRLKALDKMSKATNTKERIKYFKRCVVVTKKHIDGCRKLLDLMGVPYINALEEADSQCAKLACEGLVSAVATEDMDILTFGSPCILRNFSIRKKNVLEVNIDDILKNLNITKSEFINLCIMFGCDYCHRIYGLSLKNILENIRNNDIKKFLIESNKNNIGKLHYNDYIKAFTYFNNPKTIDVDKADLVLKKPQYNELLDFLVNVNGFSKYKIKIKIDRLMSNYNSKQN